MALVEIEITIIITCQQLISTWNSFSSLHKHFIKTLCDQALAHNNISKGVHNNQLCGIDTKHLYT